VFGVARQMSRQNRDVVGSGYMKDFVGKVLVEEGKVLDTWKS